eukprot:SAG25_NODE_1232_length_3544_cov_1.651089_1_plen_467_part_00
MPRPPTGDYSAMIPLAASPVEHGAAAGVDHHHTYQSSVAAFGRLSAAAPNSSINTSPSRGARKGSPLACINESYRRSCPGRKDLFGHPNRTKGCLRTTICASAVVAAACAVLMLSFVYALRPDETGSGMSVILTRDQIVFGGVAAAAVAWVIGVACWWIILGCCGICGTPIFAVAYLQNSQLPGGSQPGRLANEQSVQQSAGARVNRDLESGNCCASRCKSLCCLTPTRLLKVWVWMMLFASVVAIYGTVDQCIEHISYARSLLGNGGQTTNVTGHATGSESPEPQTVHWSLFYALLAWNPLDNGPSTEIIVYLNVLSLAGVIMSLATWTMNILDPPWPNSLGVYVRRVLSRIVPLDLSEETWEDQLEQELSTDAGLNRPLLEHATAIDRTLPTSDTNVAVANLPIASPADAATFSPATVVAAFCVQVPEGVMVGQQFYAQKPSGEMMLVTVPAGGTPGMTLQIDG